VTWLHCSIPDEKHEGAFLACKRNVKHRHEGGVLLTCCGARNRTGVWRLCIPTTIFIAPPKWLCGLDYTFIQHHFQVNLKVVLDVCQLVSTPSLYFHIRLGSVLPRLSSEVSPNLTDNLFKYYYLKRPIEPPEVPLLYPALSISLTVFFEAKDDPRETSLPVINPPD